VALEKDVWFQTSSVRRRVLKPLLCNNGCKLEVVAVTLNHGDLPPLGYSLRNQIS
jgi:hypothetical protein